MKKTTTSKPSLAANDEPRAVAEQIGALRKTMTFLVPLTEVERQKHRASRIGMKKLRTIASRLTAARENRDHLPPAFDLRKFERDATRTASLTELLAVIDEMRSAVHDTLMVVASRAAVGADSVHGYLELSSDSAERLKRTVETITTRVVRSPAQEAPAQATLPAGAGKAAESSPPTGAASTGGPSTNTNAAVTAKADSTGPPPAEPAAEFEPTVDPTPKAA